EPDLGEALDQLALLLIVELVGGAAEVHAADLAVALFSPSDEDPAHGLVDLERFAASLRVAKAHRFFRSSTSMKLEVSSSSMRPIRFLRRLRLGGATFFAAVPPESPEAKSA